MKHISLFSPQIKSTCLRLWKFCSAGICTWNECADCKSWGERVLLAVLSACLSMTLWFCVLRLDFSYVSITRWGTNISSTACCLWQPYPEIASLHFPTGNCVCRTDLAEADNVYSCSRDMGLWITDTVGLNYWKGTHCPSRWAVLPEARSCMAFPSNLLRCSHGAHCHGIWVPFSQQPLHCQCTVSRAGTTKASYNFIRKDRKGKRQGTSWAGKESPASKVCMWHKIEVE